MIATVCSPASSSTSARKNSSDRDVDPFVQAVYPMPICHAIVLADCTYSEQWASGETPIALSNAPARRARCLPERVEMGVDPLRKRARRTPGDPLDRREHGHAPLRGP